MLNFLKNEQKDISITYSEFMNFCRNITIKTKEKEIKENFKKNLPSDIDESLIKMIKLNCYILYTNKQKQKINLEKLRREKKNREEFHLKPKKIRMLKLYPKEKALENLEKLFKLVLIQQQNLVKNK